MQINRRHILILFPPRETGKNISKKFIENGYRVSLLIFKKEEPVYKELTETKGAYFSVYTTEESNKEITAQVKELLRAIDILLNFIGTDFLALHVKGENAQWQIDHNAAVNQKFVILDSVVKSWDKAIEVLWLNVLYGKMSDSSGGHTFCPARYALSGFENLLKMNPAFENTKITNICLSYLKHSSMPEHTHHCADCEAEYEGLIPDEIAERLDATLLYLVNENIK